MGNFKFGDKSTKDLGLVIQFKPNYTFPERDVQIEHIPGRNGDLMIDNGCYQNVTRTYSVAAIFNPAEGFVQSATKLVEWLTKQKGYQRLEDSYEPEVYRKAMFNSGGTLQNIYDRATVLEISFDCKPQRFLKEGEVPIEFTGSQALLENPTVETAEPLIKIYDLPTQQDDSVVLASILDNDGKAVSLMTLTGIPSNHLYIDSEKQEVYSDSEDLDSYVNLNGYSFPKLGRGETTIKIGSYKQHSYGAIPSYSSLISSNKKVLHARYLPFSKNVEAKQKMYSVKPYNLLKQSKQEVYEAKAYASYLLENCTTYTFMNFNQLLTRYGYLFSVVGNPDENFLPGWLLVDYVRTIVEGKEVVDEKNLSLKLGTSSNFETWIKDTYGEALASSISLAGVFIKNPVTKDIAYYAFGSTVVGTMSKTTSRSFEVYFAKKDTSPAELYTNYELLEDGKPSYLEARIEYDGANRKVTKVNYVTTVSINVYLEKTGLFGKSKWYYKALDSEHPEKPVVLDSVSWTGYKNAFISMNGLSVSTTSTFTYKTIKPEDYPLQYQPVMGPKLDENGNQVVDDLGNVVYEEKNKVHFNITSSNVESDVQYNSKEAGYYRGEAHPEASQNDWVLKEANSQLASDIMDPDTSKSNILYYLESIPTYDGENNFPEWLDPVPENAKQGNVNKTINPTKIKFYVTKRGWYRTSTVDDSGNTQYTAWVLLNAGTLLNYELPVDKLSIVYYLAPLEDSNVFPISEYTYTYTKDGKTYTIHDIGFFDGEGTTAEEYEQLPDWIDVEISDPDSSDVEDKDKTLRFVAKSNASPALYKVDTSVDWAIKAINTELTTSTHSQDTLIECLEGYPEYDTSSSWREKYDYEVLSSSTGNPESIKFKVKEDGYYKSQDSSDWKYMLAGDDIYIEKISETTVLYDLKEESESSFDNVKISVTPRWWKL